MPWVSTPRWIPSLARDGQKLSLSLSSVSPWVNHKVVHILRCRNLLAVELFKHIKAVQIKRALYNLQTKYGLRCKSTNSTPVIWMNNVSEQLDYQAMSSSLSLIGCKILLHGGQGLVTFDLESCQRECCRHARGNSRRPIGVNSITMEERRWRPSGLVFIFSKMAVCYCLILFLRFYISLDTWVQTSLHNNWWDIISII